MKIEFDYRIDGKVHHFTFQYEREDHFQIKIDDEVMMQKLGA